MTPYDDRTPTIPSSLSGLSPKGLDRTAALRAMVRQSPPADCGVVEGSTPVVAFGDFQTARIATLGINPSQAEFLRVKPGQDKKLLSGAERRLATLSSLKAATLPGLTDQQADEVLANCRSYFHRNPLTVWFNQLNHALKALGANYYDDSACHLDVSMWATDPKWNDLTVTAKQTLLNGGKEPLQWLLTFGGFDTVVVNGKAVWDQLEQTGLIEATAAGTMQSNSASWTTTIKRATLGATKIVGWTVNVQSSFGVQTVDKVALGETVRAVLDDW